MSIPISFGTPNRISVFLAGSTRRVVPPRLSLAGRVRPAVSTYVLKLAVTNPHVCGYVYGFGPRTIRHRRISGVLGLSLALRSALPRSARSRAFVSCDSVRGECLNQCRRFGGASQWWYGMGCKQPHSIHRSSISTFHRILPTLAAGSPLQSPLGVDRNDDWKDAVKQPYGGEPTSPIRRHGR